ncbi:hypothetical protein [Flavobacterium sp.]|uniref:hypothetical protein n=1 Tax=Flavobacterium sp. TaxID=239 RepID=UPI004047FF74
MKSTNFDYNGGFPFDQSTLKRLQEAVFEHIKVHALQLGCQETGNYILYGCQVVGANITAGTMFIDGEVCPFAGAVGDATTKIKKQTNTANAPFENGTNPPVFIETIAVVNATGTPLQDYQRLYHVQDANYVHTDNNLTAALLAKLNGIEPGAEENVQADWDVVNPLSDAFIKNKPNITQWYHRATANIGTISQMYGFSEITINFPDIGVSNYFVIGNITASNNVAVIVTGSLDKTSTSFKLKIYKPSDSSTAVNCVLDYYLLPNP